MCVCVLQVFCAPAVGTHAGEDSLEWGQESCCGRGDDESTIRRVMGRRQAAAGELAGMGCWYATVTTELVVSARRRADRAELLLLRVCDGRNGCVCAMEPD